MSEPLEMNSSPMSNWKFYLSLTSIWAKVYILDWNTSRLKQLLDNDELFYFPSWSDGWRKFWRSSERRPWSIHAVFPVILPQDDNTQETFVWSYHKKAQSMWWTLVQMFKSLSKDWSYIFLLIDPMPFQCHQSLSPRLVDWCSPDHCKCFNMGNIYISN